jgi:hypothetical protein
MSLCCGCIVFVLWDCRCTYELSEFNCSQSANGDSPMVLVRNYKLLYVELLRTNRCQTSMKALLFHFFLSSVLADILIMIMLPRPPNILNNKS